MANSRVFAKTQAFFDPNHTSNRFRAVRAIGALQPLFHHSFSLEVFGFIHVHRIFGIRFRT